MGNFDMETYGRVGEIHWLYNTLITEIIHVQLHPFRMRQLKLYDVYYIYNIFNILQNTKHIRSYTVFLMSKFELIYVEDTKISETR